MNTTIKQDVSNESKELINATMYKLWCNYTEHMNEERDIEPLKPLLEAYGVSTDSNLAIMYDCFIHGVLAGMELYSNM